MTDTTSPQNDTPHAGDDLHDAGENEVLRAAREAKEARKRAEESAKGGSPRKGWKAAAAAAAGLGSAAVVAALLYSRKDK